MNIKMQLLVKNKMEHIQFNLNLPSMNLKLIVNFQD